jgi:hypothetical protein
VYQRGVSLILTELLMKTKMKNNNYETKELLEKDEFDCLSEKNAVELCAAFVQIRYSQFLKRYRSDTAIHVLIHDKL